MTKIVFASPMNKTNFAHFGGLKKNIIQNWISNFLFGDC